jgi:hypothetical protein
MIKKYNFLTFLFLVRKKQKSTSQATVLYSVFHRFEQAKCANGGLIFFLDLIFAIVPAAF